MRFAPVPQQPYERLDQVIAAAGDELKKQLFNKKDTTAGADSTKKDPKKQLEETGKGLIKNLFGKKKSGTDSTKH